MGFKERAKQRAKALAAGDRFKLKEDENFLRILPTPESEDGAEDDVCYEIAMHSDLGPEGKGFQACGHPVATPDEGTCYACDKYIPRLLAQGNSETAKEIRAKPLQVFQVLAVEEQDGKNRYTGPHFWMVGGAVGRNLLVLLGSGKRDITDPVKGYTFSITRTGSGKDTRYSAPILDEEPSKIPSKYVEMLKPFLSLTELPVYSEQAMKDAIKGVKSGASAPTSPSRRAGVLDEDEDQDETPKSKKRRPEPEEDEDAPVVKVKTAKTKPAPDPEPDEDEDEDEAPVTTKAKTLVTVSKAAEEPTKPASGKKGKQESLDFEDETPKGKKKPAVEPDEDEDEASPVPAGKKKPAATEPPPAAAKAKKPAVPPPDEDEDEDDPFGDDDD
jgi:hypothetical protein